MIYNKFEEDDTIATVARTKTLVMEPVFAYLQQFLFLRRSQITDK